MGQEEKVHINLAGEFLVAGELNRRQISSSITYGAYKRADIFAFSRDSKRLARIEVKATNKKSRPVGHRAMTDKNRSEGVFWVLVELPPPPKSPSYFVFTGNEVATLTKHFFDAYMEGFEKRHGRPYSGDSVPVLNLDDVTEYRDKWESIERYLEPKQSPS
jgi:hypothetical protein